MGDKSGLVNRVNDLLIDPNVIQHIEVVGGNIRQVISNTPRTVNSLQIYAAITSNRGWITPESAQNGLKVYGEELVDESRKLKRENSENRHRNIEILEEIVAGGIPIRSEIHTSIDAKPYPLTSKEIAESILQFGTPFILYNEDRIRERAQALNAAFAWVPGGFKNHFAVKANDNNHIVRILKEEGNGADCSSMKELRQSRELGFRGDEVIFTANNVPVEEFSYAKGIGATINFDDITHIPFFMKYVGRLPGLVCCRFNPGSERVGNSIIGNPSESKYGMRRDQIIEAVRMLKKHDVKEIGIHTMIASNERNSEYFVETGRMMFGLAGEIKRETGVEVPFVNLGGGLGTAYRPEHREVDINAVSNGIKTEYEKMVAAGAIRPDLKIFMENGRWLTGPSGILVSKVLHVTEKHKKFIGLDASMASLPRPAIYDAYHHISVFGEEEAIPRVRYDVTGSLCENNDKFGVDRLLPEINSDKFVIIHNAGAHCYVMGSHYNGKEKCAEVLFNGDFKLIRRASNYEDMMATQI